MLQMEGGGHGDVLPVLRVPANKADAVPYEGLPRTRSGLKGGERSDAGWGE